MMPTCSESQTHSPPSLKSRTYDNDAKGEHNIWGIITPAANDLELYKRAFVLQGKLLVASNPTTTKTP